MTTQKSGPLQRIAQALGLGRTTGGARIPYEGCWACSLGKHGVTYDGTCTCCRNSHAPASLTRH